MLSTATAATADACLQACLADANCRVWAWCPSNETAGCAWAHMAGCGPGRWGGGSPASSRKPQPLGSLPACDAVPSGHLRDLAARPTPHPQLPRALRLDRPRRRCARCARHAAGGHLPAVQRRL